MNSCELIAFVSSFSCLLSQCVDNDELELLAALFTQLGDKLATILIANDLNNNC